MTQCEMVWNHLKQYGSITQNDASREYGVGRLGARIWDLRNLYGKDIYTRNETKKNRFGVSTTYARYWIKEGENK